MCLVNQIYGYKRTCILFIPIFKYLHDVFSIVFSHHPPPPLWSLDPPRDKQSHWQTTVDYHMAGGYLHIDSGFIPVPLSHSGLKINPSPAANKRDPDGSAPTRRRPDVSDVEPPSGRCRAVGIAGWCRLIGWTAPDPDDNGLCRTGQWPQSGRGGRVHSPRDIRWDLCRARGTLSSAWPYLSHRSGAHPTKNLLRSRLSQLSFIGISIRRGNLMETGKK